MKRFHVMKVAKCSCLITLGPALPPLPFPQDEMGNASLPSLSDCAESPTSCLTFAFVGIADDDTTSVIQLYHCYTETSIPGFLVNLSSPLSSQPATAESGRDSSGVNSSFKYSPSPCDLHVQLCRRRQAKLKEIQSSMVLII